MLADALGRPLRLIVTAGQVGDVTQAAALLEGQTGDAVLADKAYDSNALRALIAGIGAEAVIPSNRTPASINAAIASSAASTASSTSAVSLPVTTDALFTSLDSSTSPQP